METKINVISDNEHELEISMTYDEIRSDIEDAYKTESKKIELPGFRKGKVPMAMIKRLYGEALEYKTSEKIAGKKFWEIVDEQKLSPISTPKIMDINLEDGIKLSFKIRYEVMPVIDVKNYTGNEITKINWQISDEMINEEILSLRRANATEEDAEIVENENYLLNINIKRTDLPEKGLSENITIDLSDKRISPEIVNNALNKKKGEIFNFTIPGQQTKEEDGEKKVVTENISYEAEIISIKKLVMPEFNNELVEKITNNKFKTPEDWEKNIRQGLEDFYKRQSDEFLVNSLISKVIENNEFEPPHGYVHVLLDRMIDSEMEKAKKEGIKKIDEHELHHRLHPRAETSAKWHVLMKSIAAKENLVVDEATLNELAEKESAETGISKEKLLKYYNDTNQIEYMLENKVIDFLKTNNNIKEVNPKDYYSNKTTEG